MLEVHKDNFDAEVLNADGIVMVDFWGESCEVCLEIMPDIVDLSKKYENNIKFCKLNIKGNRRLAMSQKVMGLPSFVFYKDGEPVAKISGEDVEPSEVEEKIKELIS